VSGGRSIRNRCNSVYGRRGGQVGGGDRCSRSGWQAIAGRKNDDECSDNHSDNNLSKHWISPPKIDVLISYYTSAMPIYQLETTMWIKRIFKKAEFTK